VKKTFLSIASSTCLSMSFAVRTAITLGFGTRGFFGSTRSCHSQMNCLSFTKKRKSSGLSLTPSRASAMRRTSLWLATRV